MTPAIGFDRGLTVDGGGVACPCPCRARRFPLRKPFAAVVALALLAGSAPSLAAPCRDAKGKFAKCSTTTKPATRCRGANGKFAKCGLPGTHPA